LTKLGLSALNFLPCFDIAWVTGRASDPATNKYQLSLMNPRDALLHGKRAANKGGRSVW